MGVLGSKVPCYANVPSPTAGDCHVSVVSAPLDAYVTEERLLDGIVKVLRNPPLASNDKLIARKVTDASECQFTVSDTYLDDEGRGQVFTKVTHIDRANGTVVMESCDEKRTCFLRDYMIILKDPLRVECFYKYTPQRAGDKDTFDLDTDRIALQHVIEGKGRIGEIFGMFRKIRYKADVPSPSAPLGSNLRSCMTENLYGIIEDDIFVKMFKWLDKPRRARYFFTTTEQNFRVAKPVAGSVRITPVPGLIGVVGYTIITLTSTDHIQWETWIGADPPTKAEECHWQLHKGYKFMKIEAWRYGTGSGRTTGVQHDDLWFSQGDMLSDVLSKVLTNNGFANDVRLIPQVRVQLDFDTPVATIKSSKVEGFDGSPEALLEAYVDILVHPDLEHTSFGAVGQAKLEVAVPSTEWTATSVMLTEHGEAAPVTVQVSVDRQNMTITETRKSSHALFQVSDGTETSRILQSPLRIETSFVPSKRMPPRPGYDPEDTQQALKRADRLQSRLELLMPCRVALDDPQSADSYMKPKLLFNQESIDDNRSKSVVSNNLYAADVHPQPEQVWEALVSALHCLKWKKLLQVDKVAKTEMISCSKTEVRTRDTVANGSEQKVIEHSYIINEKTYTIACQVHEKEGSGPLKMTNGFHVRLHRAPLQVEMWMDAERAPLVSEAAHHYIYEKLVNAAVAESSN